MTTTTTTAIARTTATMKKRTTRTNTHTRARMHTHEEIAERVPFSWISSKCKSGSINKRTQPKECVCWNLPLLCSFLLVNMCMCPCPCPCSPCQPHNKKWNIVFLPKSPEQILATYLSLFRCLLFNELHQQQQQQQHQQPVKSKRMRKRNTKKKEIWVIKNET